MNSTVGPIFDSRASLIVLGFSLIVAVVVLLAWRVARNQERIERFVKRQLERPRIARIRARHHGAIAFLAERLRPEGAFGLALTIAILAVVATGWAFGAVVQDILAREGLTRIDDPVLSFFVHHREPWLTTVMLGISHAGSTAYLVPLILIVGVAWRVRARTWRPLALLVAAYAGTSLMYSVVKPLVDRARPLLADATQRFVGRSFPSGHAAQAAAVYGMLAFLTSGLTERWTLKVSAWAAAVLVAAFVGASRLYLGAHWLSDVLGGYALGGLWLFALLVLERVLTARSVHAGAR